MRYVLLCCAVLVAACSDDNNRLAALETSSGAAAGLRRDIDALKATVAALPAGVDVKPLEDRIAALEAKVAALPPPVDVKPLADRIAALEMNGPAAVKLPHLVVDKTGEDLGQLLAGTDVVWSTKLKGEFMPVARLAVFFDQANCVGTKYMGRAHQGAFSNTTLGTVFRVRGPAAMIQYESYWDSNGMCVTQSSPTTAVPIADTGTPNIFFTPDQLRVELR